jgi:hypothetical protein
VAREAIERVQDLDVVPDGERLTMREADKRDGHADDGNCEERFERCPRSGSEIGIELIADEGAGDPGAACSWLCWKACRGCGRVRELIAERLEAFAFVPATTHLDMARDMSSAARALPGT